MAESFFRVLRGFVDNRAKATSTGDITPTRQQVNCFNRPVSLNVDGSTIGPERYQSMPSAEPDDLYGVTPERQIGTTAATRASDLAIHSSTASDRFLSADSTIPNNLATADTRTEARRGTTRDLQSIDDHDHKPAFPQEQGTVPGSTMSHSIVLDDSDPSPQGDYNSIFDKTRVKVSWGPRARLDDIITLTGCSSVSDLIARVEALKQNRPTVRGRTISAAGVSVNGRPCFRIPWQVSDAGPAFEELKNLVKERAAMAKIPLRLEVEWEDLGGDAGDTSKIKAEEGRGKLGV